LSKALICLGCLIQERKKAIQQRKKYGTETFNSPFHFHPALDSISFLSLSSPRLPILPLFIY